MWRRQALPMVVLLGLAVCPLWGGAAARQSGVHPVVCANWEILLGGMVDGRWREPDAVAPLLWGGERYQLYTLAQRLGSAVGTKAHLVEGEGYGYAQVLTLSPAPKGPGIIVGVAGPWDALPRVPRVGSSDQAVYRQAVAGHLKSKGMVVAVPRVTQVLRVDLDGDSTEEVVISANSGGPAEEYVWPKDGSYSVVLLRDVVKGKVVTRELAENHVVRLDPEEPPNFAVFSVAAVLDLTGDGRMEVLVHGQWYEGDSLIAYRVADARVTKVFEEGIGA